MAANNKDLDFETEVEKVLGKRIKDGRVSEQIIQKSSIILHFRDFLLGTILSQMEKFRIQ